MPSARALPELVVRPAAVFAEAAAEWIAVEMRGALETRERCRLALSGGSTPSPVYRKLASAPAIEWERVDFFFGDERLVGPEDEQSNYRMARQALSEPFGRGRVFRIAGELPAEQAAREYASVLGESPLDVLLLGIGDDGHTASLFPAGGYWAADERVIVTVSPKPPPERISLSLKTINEARVVIFLVAGAAKASPLADVHREIVSGTPKRPAARVQPRHGRLVWLMDSDAAGELTIESTRKEE